MTINTASTKPADTEFPILDCLAHRWSPRAFADKAVEPDKLKQLFEAARWAASAFNEQPWRFVLATKDRPDDYARVLGCLVEANQSWAKHAPVLMINCVSELYAKNGKDNTCAEHDLGLAMGNLSAQATALGLVVHQMAGIDADKAKNDLNIPGGFKAFTGVALGYEGDPGQLDEGWQRDAETAPRERKPFGDFVFDGTFGEASKLFTG